MKKIMIYMLVYILTICFSNANNLSNITAESIDFVEIGDILKENGKIIKLIGVGETKVIFDVDGVIGFVQNKGNVNGVDIFIDSIYQDPSRVIMRISVPFDCGDGICGDNENSKVCCTDCNCTREIESCISNICVDKSLSKCEGNADCDDGDICTKNICDGSPAECRFQLITECKRGDGCCPEGCTYLTDKDCEKPDQCTSDEQCDDNNACTQDFCLGDERKKCYYNYTKRDCNLDGKCVYIGTVDKNEKTYCFEHDWISQREDESECQKNYECINTCYKNICTKLGFFKRILYSLHLI